MLGNILSLLVLMALAVVCGFLTWRTFKFRPAILKWLAVVPAGLLTLLFALLTIVVAKGLWTFYAPYPVPEAHVTVVASAEQISRGEHIATVMCATCHSTNLDLPLSGGNNLSDDAGLPLGDLYAPNITTAGVIRNFSDDDLWRILRTGVDPRGRLTFMAGVPASKLSDEDAVAVLAYLRHSAAIEKQTPPINFSVLLALFAGAGLVQATARSAINPISAPPKAVSKEYGEYWVGLLDCRGCHGPTLSGDAPPPSPPGAANITLIVPNWTRDEFFQTMRTGTDKTGHRINPPMPWRSIGKLDDVELAALYEYLHGLSPIVKR